MFTSYQQAELRGLVRPKLGGSYQGTPNLELDEYIDKLRALYPHKFHQDTNSLRKRVFFDEPNRLPGQSAIPMNRFIKPLNGWSE
jgi:hypothetical protein